MDLNNNEFKNFHQNHMNVNAITNRYDTLIYTNINLFYC
jgi:hypothetical protein